MKKIVFILISCLLVLSSCQKKGINAFIGEYSFKSSGDVFIQKGSDNNNDLIPSSFNYKLPDEIGQLEICTLDSKENTVLVVINYMDGEIITTKGTCEGQSIELKPFSRNTMKLSVYSLLSTNCVINIKATGHIYDDNTIVLDMVYDGTASIAGLSYAIHGNNIQMIATRN